MHFGRGPAALGKAAFATLALAASACGDLLRNEGFSIDCSGSPCNWTVVEGHPRFGAGWHDGDPGVDMSGDGRVVIEQTTGSNAYYQGDLELQAAIVRDPGVTLAFTLDWYLRGWFVDAGCPPADGPTTCGARHVGSVSVPVRQSGVFHFRTIIGDAFDANQLVFGIVKSGKGRAIVDQLSLHAYTGTAR